VISSDLGLSPVLGEPGNFCLRLNLTHSHACRTHQVYYPVGGFGSLPPKGIDGFGEVSLGDWPTKKAVRDCNSSTIVFVCLRVCN